MAEVIGRRLVSIAEDDPAASERVGELLGLVEEPHPAGDEEVSDDGPFDPAGEGRDEEASRAFNVGHEEEGSVDHEDDNYFQVVQLTEGVAQDWFAARDVGDGMELDTAVVRMLDRLGAWAGVLAIRWGVLRSTGEVTFLHRLGEVRERGDDGRLVGHRPELLVTTDPDPPPGWATVDWAEAEACARFAVTRRRLTRLELMKARAA